MVSRKKKPVEISAARPHVQATVALVAGRTTARLEVTKIQTRRNAARKHVWNIAVHMDSGSSRMQKVSWIRVKITAVRLATWMTNA